MTTTTVNRAVRSRDAKRILEQAFGRGKVRVRSGKGTSYGWLYIDIAYQPRDWDQAAELRRQVIAALKAGGVAIFSYDSADYGSGHEIRVTFQRCLYRTTWRNEDGILFGMLEGADKWERISPT